MKSVMIVGDRGIADIIKSILEKNNFDVTVASTSKEAIELMERKKIDILLIHPKLPDEDVLVPVIPDQGEMIEKTIPVNCNEKDLVNFLSSL